MTHRARFRLSRLACVCIAGAASFFLPTSAGAQDEATLERFYEGTEVLRRIFFDQGFAPIASFDDLANENPKDVILFFLGSKGIQRFPGLEGFVRRGGAVMIATSFPLTPRAWDEVTALSGWQILGQPLEYRTEMQDIPQADRKHYFYEERPHCPFLVPRKQSGDPFDRLFLKPGATDTILDRVAANEPSYLLPTRRGPRATELASLPRHGFEELRPRRPVRMLPAIAVGGLLGEGRFLVVASHRVFLNRMMLPSDTDNVDFARNCLSLLQERSDGTRKKILFVELEGKVNSDFNVKLMEFDPLEHLPELIAAGVLEFGRWLPQLQVKLARAEERDNFHRDLWRILESKGITGSDVMHWVLVTSSAFFAVYGLYRIGGPGRYRIDSTAPLLPRVLAGHQPQVTLIEQRRQALLDDNNLWEAAREKARTVLVAAGIPGPGPGGRAPRVRVRGGWWGRWRTQRRVLRLWRLAFDPKPQRVPKTAWAPIDRELGELKAALASGDVRFA
jgi:hypothetical protein